MKRARSLVVLLLLTGCVAAPERRQVDLDVTVPQSWSESENG